MITGQIPTFLIACFGGLLAELLKWYRLRESPNLPVYSKSPLYWSLTALMILAGGGLALLYGTAPKNPLLVANIGLSAPLIIKALADTSQGSHEEENIRVQTPGFGFDRRKTNKELTSSILNFLGWR